MQVYKDYDLALCALKRVRHFYPNSRLIVISDGDPDPRYKNFVTLFNAEYIEGDHLSGIQNGGRLLHRWLEHYVFRPSPYFIRIDTDTRIDRRFHYLPIPIGCDIFGNPQAPKSVQGGCIIFSSKAAKKLYDSRIFMSEELKDYSSTWGSLLPRNLLKERVDQGIIATDWILAWACTKLDINIVNFSEIHSRWKEEIPNPDKRYAVVHPDKKMECIDNSEIPLSITLSICRRVYRRYKIKILSKIFKKETYRPWMAYEEIEIIEQLLKRFQPRNILEWGAGYSTLWFPKFINKNAKWEAVEHEKEWFNKIDMMNENKNVNISLIQPNHFPWSDEYGDGAYSDLKDYVEFPSHFSKFDFILVDGRARKDCLVKAHEIIAANGIIVLHDAERQYYHESFPLYKYQIMLSNYDCTGRMLWIGSKALDINHILDIRKLKKLWEIYRKLRNVRGK